MTAGTVYDLLRARAESSPSSIALFAPVRAPLTYAGLCRHLEQVVGVLNSHGLGRGDRVALVLPNGPEMLTAFLAVACGAGAAPLNPALTGGEFDSAFQDLRIGAVIVPASTESPARAVAKKRGLPVFELSFDPNDPAGIFTLGGRKTVSNPIRNPARRRRRYCLGASHFRRHRSAEIVPLRQSALIAGADLTIGALHLAASDRYLCVMPMHHVHALMTSLAGLLAGGAAIAVPPFDAGDFFRWLAEFRPTCIPRRRPFIKRFWRGHANTGDCRRKFAALHSFFGRPCRPSWQHWKGLWRARDQKAQHDRDLLIRDQQSAAAARKKLARWESPAASKSRLSMKGHAASHRQPGAISLRGANIMTAYENNTDANSESFVDGWFRTGDQGYLDRDRYLYITGRLKETINRGGEKISPGEVEEVLAQHPEVAAAVVFAVPHPTLGEDIAAAVVLRHDSGSRVSDLRRYVAARLVGHKVPGQILIVDAIPASSTGKVQRTRLAQLLADRRQAEFVEPRNGHELCPEIWQMFDPIHRYQRQFLRPRWRLDKAPVVNRIASGFKVTFSINLTVAPTVAAMAQG